VINVFLVLAVTVVLCCFMFIAHHLLAYYWCRFTDLLTYDDETCMCGGSMSSHTYLDNHAPLSQKEWAIKAWDNVKIG